MYDGSEGNAMTEVALALAMGFFSILVLTLVSMGAGGAGSAERPEKSVATTLVQLALSDSSAAPASDVGADDQIVIVHRGALLDSVLKPLDPNSLDAARRVVLAIDPGAPIDQALEAFKRVGRPDAMVAALDQRWQETLSQLDQGARP